MHYLLTIWLFIIILLFPLHYSSTIQCPDDQLRYLPGIDHILAIENHNFERLDSTSFEGVHLARPQLNSLLLRNTNISAIGPDTFSSLSTTLTCLDLTNNHLSIIDNNGMMFRGLRRLDTLIMRQNRLKSIDDSAFFYVRNVIRLDLTNNKLGTLSLSSGAFRGLDRLKELRLDSNTLTHLSPLLLSHLPSLFKISLSNNPLSHLGIYAVPKLRTVIAKNSLISKFPRFPSSTKHIDLEDGLISTINNQRKSDLRKIATLFLSGNPWNCSCQLLWLMNESESIISDFKNMTCYWPKFLRNFHFEDAIRNIHCNIINSSEAITLNTRLKLHSPVNYVQKYANFTETTGIPYSTYRKIGETSNSTDTSILDVDFNETLGLLLLYETEIENQATNSSLFAFTFVEYSIFSFGILFAASLIGVTVLVLIRLEQKTRINDIIESQHRFKPKMTLLPQENQSIELSKSANSSSVR